MNGIISTERAIVVAAVEYLMLKVFIKLTER